MKQMVVFVMNGVYEQEVMVVMGLTPLVAWYMVSVMEVAQVGGKA